MGEIAQLITAIAALVTATGGAVAAVILALRSSGRQRFAAAEEATRLSHPSGARHRRDEHGIDSEIARGVADLARDATELARETNREERFKHLEFPGPAEPLPGGGADV